LGVYTTVAVERLELSVWAPPPNVFLGFAPHLFWALPPDVLRAPPPDVLWAPPPDVRRGYASPER
jgi:hypothetical protein